MGKSQVRPFPCLGKGADNVVPMQPPGNSQTLAPALGEREGTEQPSIPATPLRTGPDPVRVGLLGCGNVGAALAGLILRRRTEIASAYGVDIQIVAVAVRNPGASRAVELPGEIFTDDAASVARASKVDVVVELIGGLQPATGLICASLEAGKPVVTANKEALAANGPKLAAAAASGGAPLLYEAAVGGGIPVIRALSESLAGESLKRVMGIVNGTTNYILGRMSDDGATYAESLSEAQKLGYAEEDPAADVDGHDAAAKVAIMASIAFGVDVSGSDVYREGISQVRPDDIVFAKRLGYVIKLLGIAERIEGGSVAAHVHPAMVPVAHPLASVRGSFNAVFVEGEAVGELMLYGLGAGGAPTASAVLGDLIEAGRHVAAARRHAASQARAAAEHKRPIGVAKIRPIEDLRTAYYLALEVEDRPGVLASVAGVFGAEGVSILSMEQEGLGSEARLIFITHTATERDMRATINGLRKLAAVRRVGSLIRVIGDEQG